LKIEAPVSYLDSLRVFVRVVARGSISAGGRDLRLTPAAASNRIKDLETRFGVRLFNRTTRKLAPTEIGAALYENARKVIAALDETEAMLSSYAGTPQGVLRVVSPLGLGRRLIAPIVQRFCEEHPEIQIRLRLSDRAVNIVEEGVDVAFFLGQPEDSGLSWRKIADCRRALVAAPAYLEKRGAPLTPDDLMDHNCLLLRYPRSPEYFWVLETPEGRRKMMVAGQFDADDADVLTAWALEGAGIVNRPVYEVQQRLDEGALVEVLPETPPIGAQLGCLMPHREFQDPKVRLFIDYAVQALKGAF
jgi:DNA-binding transcriptional LysR family regulator